MNKEGFEKANSIYNSIQACDLIIVDLERNNNSVYQFNFLSRKLKDNMINVIKKGKNDYMKELEKL
jgi:hypothetical protein